MGTRCLVGLGHAGNRNRLDGSSWHQYAAILVGYEAILALPVSGKDGTDGRGDKQLFCSVRHTCPGMQSYG